MTIIAWDGRTLACDSQASHESGFIEPYVFNKTIVVGPKLYALSGTASLFKPIVEYWENEKFSLTEYDRYFPKDSTFAALQILNNKASVLYHDHIYPDELPGSTAIGSGSLYASAMLANGFDSIRAAYTACICSQHCCLPIFSYRFDENIWHQKIHTGKDFEHRGMIPREIILD